MTGAKAYSYLLARQFMEFDPPVFTPSEVLQRSFTYREHVKAQLE
jgi:hypothetical protein